MRNDLGRRLELVSMDPYFFDISVALHRSNKITSFPTYEINSYSTRKGTSKRLDSILVAMTKIAGMNSVGDNPMQVQFSCGAGHEKAVRRTFIEACKLDTRKPIEPRPMKIYDRKTETTIHITPHEEGIYKITSDLENKRVTKRLSTVASGLIKLAGMEPLINTDDMVYFSCRHNHHHLVSMLLKMALNTRGLIREQELANTRGVLNAPGQKE